MRLLVIEDEEKTSGYLRSGLSENGFIVDTSSDGEEGLNLAKHSEYDLIILDVLLPRREGWSVLRELRRMGNQTPVLLLSAIGSVDARVRGLGLGADDYLVKPFSFSELLARIRSILRRAPARQQELLRVSDLEIDIPHFKASRGGKRIDLTPKEFQLLSLLARRPGEVFTRTVIAEQVWGMNFDCDTNVVDVHIRRLRSKMDEPFAVKLIHTVRGLGYVLEIR
jgi:two-component system copper resistance phosphate regulon response regulator CusR